MKYMLIVASMLALAVASPAQRGQVQPGVPIPAPAPEFEPIVAEPAPILPDDIFAPVVPAPAPVPVPAPVPEPVPAPTPARTPLVQIILNINADTQVAAPVAPTLPIGVVPEQIVPVPVEVSPPVVVVPEPVEIGAPELPTPELVPEPVQIGTPILPLPAANLPIDLN